MRISGFARWVLNSSVNQLHTGMLIYSTIQTVVLQQQQYFDVNTSYPSKDYRIIHTRYIPGIYYSSSCSISAGMSMWHAIWCECTHTLLIQVSDAEAYHACMFPPPCMILTYIQVHVGVTLYQVLINYLSLCEVS